MRKCLIFWIALFLYAPFVSGQGLQDTSSLNDLRKSLLLSNINGLLQESDLSYLSDARSRNTYILNKSILVPEAHSFNWSLSDFEDRFNSSYKTRLSMVAIAIPASGIGYGLLSFNNKALRNFDFSTRNEVVENHPRFHTSVDDYLLFAPLIALTGLNIEGLNGKNKFSEELGIYGLSNLMLLSTVVGVKNISHRLRPDESVRNSFPSGHTAIAFAGAEWLRMEYGKSHPWIGVLGYVSASSVGALRIYNNKHWVSDVVTGAAVGFLSTRVSYLIYPWLKEHVFRPKNQERRDALIKF